jgi:hypothetical protein
MEHYISDVAIGLPTHMISYLSGAKITSSVDTALHNVLHVYHRIVFSLIRLLMWTLIVNATISNSYTQFWYWNAGKL